MNKTQNGNLLNKNLIFGKWADVAIIFAWLLKVQNVFDKTAAIVMVYGHKIDNFIPVDVHVHVIANRLGWIKSKSPDETMDKLMKITPKKYWHDLNHLFVLFGKTICVSVSPFCSRCPINQYCKQVSVEKSR